MFKVNVLKSILKFQGIIVDDSIVLKIEQVKKKKLKRDKVIYIKVVSTERSAIISIGEEALKRIEPFFEEGDYLKVTDYLFEEILGAFSLDLLGTEQDVIPNILESHSSSWLFMKGGHQSGRSKTKQI